MNELTEPLARWFAPCAVLRARTAGLCSRILGVDPPGHPSLKRGGAPFERLLAM